jgi:hypothetical protein
MLAHICTPKILWWLRQEDHKFEASWAKLARCYLKNKISIRMVKIKSENKVDEDVVKLETVLLEI